MAPSLLITLALAVSVMAAPHSHPPPPGKGPTHNELFTCPISATIALPSGQTTLAVPNLPASSVLIGVGFQNYTCTAGAYVSIGAVADLFDLSCLSKVPALFNDIQDVAYRAWQSAPENAKAIGPEDGYPLAGSHFFINSPSGTGISPVWDARAASAKGNPDAYVLAAKVASLAAPTGPQDVAWLQLQGVSGALATQIYRTDTRGGSPPASCAVGSAPIQVKYVAKYWLYGGTVKI